METTKVTAEDILTKFSEVENAIREISLENISGLIEDIISVTNDITHNFTPQEYSNLEKFVENYLADDLQVYFLTHGNRSFMVEWSKHYSELTVLWGEESRMNYAKKIFERLD